MVYIRASEGPGPILPGGGDTRTVSGSRVELRDGCCGKSLKRVPAGMI
jgi:hypothetical protein